MGWDHTLPIIPSSVSLRVWCLASVRGMYMLPYARFLGLISSIQTAVWPKPQISMEGPTLGYIGCTRILKAFERPQTAI